MKSRRSLEYEYKIRYVNQAVEELQKLPENIRKQIIKKLSKTKTNPFYFYQRLEGRKEHKIRVGKYRVIVDIDESEKIIIIHRIGHRKNTYDNLTPKKDK